MPISGEYYRRLTEALGEAFQTPTDLDQMVRFSFIEKPVAAIAMGDNLQEIIFKLIKWADARDVVDELVTDARNFMPTSKALKALSEEIGALERIVVKSSTFENPEEWHAAMRRCERAICRVEIPADTGIGTGFLVNSNVLMTNFHVMKEVINKEIEASQVTFRFNYKTEADGTTMQKTETYQLEKDWLIDHSPDTELDYALMSVAGEPGNQKEGNKKDAEKRGWLVPGGHTFEKSEPLYILQHPDAGPLKLAFGFVKKTEKNRVEYTVSTLPGSSGSPCFTTASKLVALHHYGAESANRAITFSAILERLQKNNVASSLGK